LTDDQVEKLAVGDRIRRGSLTGTVHTIGPELVGIKWDEKEWSEVYTRAEMLQFSLVIGKGLQ
jgi:preprotein translocase subunit YajC